MDLQRNMALKHMQLVDFQSRLYRGSFPARLVVFEVDFTIPKSTPKSQSRLNTSKNSNDHFSVKTLKVKPKSLSQAFRVP